MVLLNDFKPKKVVLSDKTGTIKLEAFLSVDEKHMYPIFFGNEADVEKSTIWAECTHIKCETCGTIVEKRECQYSMNKSCRSCYEKSLKESYFRLPVVPLAFPIFIGENLIMDNDHLEEYLYYNEISSYENLEVHNSEVCEFKYDILETLEENFYNESFSEETLKDSVSSETYTRLEYLAEEMINIIKKSTPKLYSAIETSRVSLEEYFKDRK